MALSIGSEVGPYKILSKLGAGGMGEVYRAKDSRLDREVAIKVLPDDLAEDLNALKRFEREAKLLAALSHPNILAIHDVGTGQGISYVITELLKGEPLRQTIRGGRLPWRRAVEIAIQVAEGLSIAHSSGIVHRDLKPENIFIIKDGHVKILDFGLARQHQVAKQEELSLAPTESKVTVSGTLLGTIPYMSPEQVRGDPVDTRSDIFSAGCVLYEMLTAHRPFSGNTAADTMAAILKEDPVDPANLEKDVPPALIEIVKHCLEMPAQFWRKCPKHRIPTRVLLGFLLRCATEITKLRSTVSTHPPTILLEKPVNDLYTGFLYHQTSQPKLARAKIESARDFLEKFLEKRSESPAAHSLIGLVYAFLGRKEDAIREGKAGVDLMPVSKDAVWGPYRIEELAWIYVLASEYEAALDQLEYVTSIPAQISVPMLRIDPRWDPLRNHPRFQKLLQRHDWI